MVALRYIQRGICFAESPVCIRDFFFRTKYDTFYKDAVASLDVYVETMVQLIPMLLVRHILFLIPAGK